MDVAEALTQFESLGINIAVKGQKLVVIGPEPLTDEQRTYLRIHRTSILEVLLRSRRWNPELAKEGYVWCFDCLHFNGVNCIHTDNLFHTVTKCPQAPRKCQWYEEKAETDK